MEKKQIFLWLLIMTNWVFYDVKYEKKKSVHSC